MAISPSFVFTAQLDWLGYYASLPTGSSWFVMLLRSSGIQDDDTLVDHTNLADLLVTTTDEAVFVNSERKPVTLVRNVRTTTNDIFYTLSAPVTWVKAGSSTGGQNDSIVKALTCWKPSSGALDNVIKPCFATRIVGTTDGNDMTFRVPNGLGLIDSVQLT